MLEDEDARILAEDHGIGLAQRGQTNDDTPLSKTKTQSQNMKKALSTGKIRTKKSSRSSIRNLDSGHTDSDLGVYERMKRTIRRWTARDSTKDTATSQSLPRRKVYMNTAVCGSGDPDESRKDYMVHTSNSKYGNNYVSSAKYSAWNFAPKFLFEQFSRATNVYFLVLGILSVIDMFALVQGGAKFGLLITLGIVIAISAVREIVEDIFRHRADKKLNSSDTFVLKSGNDSINPPIVSDTTSPETTNQGTHSSSAPLASPESTASSISSGGVPSKHNTKWEHVLVGDILRICKGEHIPADLVLLKTSSDDGLAYVETKNLDGETNLKRKLCVKQISDTFRDELDLFSIHAYVECDAPNDKIYQFNGSLFVENLDITPPQGQSLPESDYIRIPLAGDNVLVRGSSVQNTDWIIGLVVYTGFETKLMQNMKAPQPKRSQVEKRINRYIGLPVVIQTVVVIIVTVGWKITCDNFGGPSNYWYISGYGAPAVSDPTIDCSVGQGFIQFVRFFLLFSYLVPIQLYVLIDIARVFQLIHIQADVKMSYDGEACQVRTAGLNEELGMITHLFTDKTGTLTANEMELKSLAFRNGSIYKVSGDKTEDEKEQQPSNPWISSLKEQWKSEERIKKSYGLPSADNAVVSAEIFKALALCHTVIPESSLNYIGNDSAAQIDAESEHSYRQETSSKGSKKSKSESKHVSMNGTDESTDGIVPTFVGAISGGGNKLDSRRETTESGNIKVGSENVGHPASITIDIDSLASQQGSAAGPLSPTAMSLSSNDVRKSSPVPKSGSSKQSGRKYQSSSPDEEALVEAAALNGFEFMLRTNETMRLNIHGTCYDWEILGLIEFSSARKRMSVIVRQPENEPMRIVTDSVKDRKKQLRLYCKGADSVLLPRMVAEEQVMAGQMSSIADDFAADGYRTLVIGFRDLDEDYFLDWLNKKANANAIVEPAEREAAVGKLEDELENDLHLIGSSAIEDKLQDQVPATLWRLRQAGVKVWVLTGDKQGTAINIAMSCGLFDESYDVCLINETDPMMVEAQCDKTIGNWSARLLLHEEEHASQTMSGRNMSKALLTNSDDYINKLKGPTAAKSSEGRNRFALVMDGFTLGFALSEEIQSKLMVLGNMANAVILCRVSPKQKGEVVEIFRKYHPKQVTLAIGDGANDVGMIQAAHVGIGIRGKEGLEAVLSSDFAVGQFRFLDRLMLVHGRWCFKRMSKLIYGVLYCAVIWGLMDFWNSFKNAFSGNPILDPLLYGLYTILLTPIPLLILAVWDYDCPQDYSLMYPELYRKSQQRAMLKYQNFLFWIFTGIAQSAWIYYSLYMGFCTGLTYASSAGKVQGYSSLGMIAMAITLFTLHAQLSLYVGAWNLYMIALWIISATIFLYAAIIFSTPVLATGLAPNYLMAAQDAWQLSQTWMLFFIVPLMCVLPSLTMRFLRKNQRPSLKDMIIESSLQGIRRETFDPHFTAPAVQKKLPAFTRRDEPVKPSLLVVYDDRGDNQSRERLRDLFVPDYEALREKMAGQLKRHGSDGDIRPAAVVESESSKEKAKHRRNKSEGTALKKRPDFSDF